MLVTNLWLWQGHQKSQRRLPRASSETGGSQAQALCAGTPDRQPIATILGQRVTLPVPASSLSHFAIKLCASVSLVCKGRRLATASLQRRSVRRLSVDHEAPNRQPTTRTSGLPLVSSPR